MIVARFLLLCGLVLLAGCSSATAPDAGLLAAQRGVVMPLARVESKIAFRPYVPMGRLLATAAIPGLGHDDARATHGVAFEYVEGRRRLLLSEWPRQDFTVTAMGRSAAASPCRVEQYSPRGVLWATRGGLIMSLQPDGPAALHAVSREAKRLIERGACG